MTERNQPPELPLQFAVDEAAAPGDVLDVLADLLLDLVDQPTPGNAQGPADDAGIP